MSPQLALVMCAAFVCGALFLDSRRNSNVSSAIWIPMIWVAILASRPVVEWFDPKSVPFGTNVEDGSAMDRNVLSLLMLVALIVLINRKLRWTQWIRENPWMFAFFLYCGISIAWSDFPVIALKRWIRALGSVMMILVLLSEKDPITAIATVVRRCGYILVPFSIVLIKYYRDLAVGHNEWTGEEFVVGVATDKNGLGRLCLVSGLFALWEVVTIKRSEHIHIDASSRLLGAAMLLVTLWLLRMSNSATSLATFIIGCGVLFVTGFSVIKKRTNYLGTLIVVCVGAVMVLGVSLDLTEVAVGSLGRDLTFTDRTFIWRDLLKMGTNPVVGVGYDSFWLGDRLEKFVREHQVNEAHNGYLEVYLELGIVGLALLACLVLGVFVKAKRSLTTDGIYGRLRITILAIFLIYNVTEAAYKATTSIFFVLLLVGIEVPVGLKSRRSQALFGGGLWRTTATPEALYGKGSRLRGGGGGKVAGGHRSGERF
jgi:exopolysaccharide production protein ExoQ